MLHYTLLTTCTGLNGYSSFNTEKDTVKTKHLLVQSHTSHSDTKLKDFKIGEAIYI